MFRVALAILILMPTVATAQPMGPAKTLYIRNSSGVAATFDIIRHEGGTSILTSLVLKDGEDIELTLKQIKGDRVLIAGSGKANAPWTVYGMSEFNGADSPFPTVGYALIKDNDTIKLVMLVQGGAGVKAFPPAGATKKNIDEKDGK